MFVLLYAHASVSPSAAKMPDPDAHGILQGISSSFVLLACTKTVVSIVTLTVSLAPLLCGLSQVQRVRPLEIYQPGKTAPEKCLYRDGQSWIEFFLLIFICQLKYLLLQSV